MNFDLREEIKRKGGRLALGIPLILIIVYLKNRYGIELTKNVSFFLVLLAIFQDYLRANLRFPIPFYDLLLKRPAEKAGLHGSTVALIACLLTLTFYDFDIAMAAVSMFLFGDAFACIIGKGFGRTKLLNQKYLEGSLAMFVVAMIAGFFFLDNVLLIAGMALFATLLEMFISKLPDDLVLPLYTGLMGQFLSIRPFMIGLRRALIAWIVLVVAMTSYLGLLSLFKKFES